MDLRLPATGETRPSGGGTAPPPRHLLIPTAEAGPQCRPAWTAGRTGGGSTSTPARSRAIGSSVQDDVPRWSSLYCRGPHHQQIKRSYGWGWTVAPPPTRRSKASGRVGWRRDAENFPCYGGDQVQGPFVSHLLPTTAGRRRSLNFFLGTGRTCLICASVPTPHAIP